MTEEIGAAPGRGHIIAAIESYCRAQTEKDHAGWTALFADEVLHEDPVGMGTRSGKGQVTGLFWDHIVRNNVRIWLTDDVIVCGREAVAIMACEIGPEGARRRLSPVVDQFVFAGDGRIISVRGFYNRG